MISDEKFVTRVFVCGVTADLAVRRYQRRRIFIAFANFKSFKVLLSASREEKKLLLGSSRYTPSVKHEIKISFQISADVR